ncbi:MAG: restriction endonuclease subunit S [Candidatus Brocadia sp.]|nr:restriction endonuclease subunit S [Candidatus Brocadia sp.]
MDIARDYLSKVERQFLEKDERLKKLEILLNKGFHYPIISLKEFIVVNNEKIKPAEYPEQEYTVLGVSNQNGVFINEKLHGEDIKQAYFKVQKSQFCYNPYRINVGSIGLCEFDSENQIISGAYSVFGCKESELNPKYLEALFKTKMFLDYVNQKASGGVRMDFKIEYLQEWQIPLPPLEVQNEIVEKIESQKQIIEGAERIEESFSIQIDNLPTEKTSEVGNICEIVYGEPLPEKDRRNGKFPVFGAGNVIGYHENFLVKGPVIIIGRRGATSGTVMWSDNSCWPIDTAFYVKIKDPRIEMKYLYYALKSLNLFKYQFGGAMPGINRNDIYSETISLPTLEIQRQIVEKLDRQMKALEGVRLLKEEAERRIAGIIAEAWGG